MTKGFTSMKPEELEMYVGISEAIKLTGLSRTLMYGRTVAKRGFKVRSKRLGARATLYHRGDLMELARRVKAEKQIRAAKAEESRKAKDEAAKKVRKSTDAPLFAVGECEPTKSAVVVSAAEFDALVDKVAMLHGLCQDTNNWVKRVSDSLDGFVNTFVSEMDTNGKQTSNLFNAMRALHGAMSAIWESLQKLGVSDLPPYDPPSSPSNETT